MGFNLIYWNPMDGCYFLFGSNLEKYGKFWKNGRFSGRIWPDWGNITRADLAGLGSIGLRNKNKILRLAYIPPKCKSIHSVLFCITLLLQHVSFT